MLCWPLFFAVRTSVTLRKFDYVTLLWNSHLDIDSRVVGVAVNATHVCVLVCWPFVNATLTSAIPVAQAHPGSLWWQPKRPV